VFAESIETKNNLLVDYDTVNINIKFENGSVGNILYIANGDSALPKEYCEIFAGGKTAIMDNFQSVIFYKNNKKIKKTYKGSKG
jgi:polar amino acid transport system substrate-binding protein